MVVVLSASLFSQYISGISARDFRLTSQAYIFSKSSKEGCKLLERSESNLNLQKTWKKCYLISRLSAGLLCAKKIKQWRGLYIDCCYHFVRISSTSSKNKIIMDIIMSTVVCCHFTELSRTFPEYNSV